MADKRTPEEALQAANAYVADPVLGVNRALEMLGADPEKFTAFCAAFFLIMDEITETECECQTCQGLKVMRTFLEPPE